jgi:small conductance mechanosensitive channel
VSYETVILSLILGAGLLAWALHWLIGLAQRRLTRWLAPLAMPAGAPPSLKSLVAVWCGNGLRTIVWVLYFYFVINLLPQTRHRFKTLGERLLEMREQIGDWLFNTGINLVIVVVATIFLMRFAAALIRAGFELFENRALDRGEITARRRAQTLAAIFRGVTQAVIFFVGLMSLLQQLRVNVTPIVASAGIVGIAVGFGAQSLIRDLFAGFLILLEDQYNVGDSVKIGETAGTIERLTLRVTHIRALDGSLTTIPNGSITVVSNLSKEWARVVLDLEIDYSEDADRAMRVLLETARQMHQERPTEIIEEPAMLGVERLTNASIVLRLTVKTAASKQAEIARELRRRSKLAFDQAGIKAPTREQLVFAREEKKPKK